MAAMALPSKLPRLCLHLDVNETILIGDPAGGDSFEDSLNKLLSKSAFVRRRGDGDPSPGGRWDEYVWHDGSPLDPLLRSPGDLPPPLLPDGGWDFIQGSLLCPSALPKVRDSAKRLPFHTVYRHLSKTFTDNESPGSIYRAELEKLRATLRWPAEMKGDPRLRDDGNHLLLPSLFTLLTTLHERGVPFSLVLRTFGSDLDRVAAALDAFADGGHPMFAPIQGLRVVSSRHWRGRYSEGAFVLLPLNEGGGPKLSSEADVVHALQGDENGPSCVAAVQDDYSHWAANEFAPGSGKPLWLTLDDSRWHHIFFDDNIHNDPQDSIVAMRVRPSAAAPFVALNGDETRRLQGLHLVKVPAYHAVMNPQFFVEQVDRCVRTMQLVRFYSQELLPRHSSHS